VKHLTLSLWLVVASCSSQTFVTVILKDGTVTHLKSAARLGGRGIAVVETPDLWMAEYTNNEISLRDSVAAIPGAWGAVANTLLTAQSARLHAAGMGVKLPQ
jgi:hypothetical protein